MSPAKMVDVCRNEVRGTTWRRRGDLYDRTGKLFLTPGAGRTADYVEGSYG
jgi:hypothetical protein